MVFHISHILYNRCTSVVNVCPHVHQAQGALSILASSMIIYLNIYLPIYVVFYENQRNWFKIDFLLFHGNCSYFSLLPGNVLFKYCRVWLPGICILGIVHLFQMKTQFIEDHHCDAIQATQRSTLNRKGEAK